MMDSIIYYSPGILLIVFLTILILKFPFAVGVAKSAFYRVIGRKSIEVSGLYVYPIKSCRGFQVNRTLLRMQGLDLDRRWMFVNPETGNFLTIREHPKMTQIQPALSTDGELLEIHIASRPGDNETNLVSIPARPSSEWLARNTTLASVQIWKAETDGYLYGDSVNQPFSGFLGRPVCLVYKGPTPRILRGNGSPEILGRTQDTFFPDVHPVTIASESSLAELSSRMAAKKTAGIDIPITMERFRPNIIVKGNAPFTEDSWKLIRLRAPDQTDSSTTASQPLDIDITGLRTRCQIPNVDPETAEKHKTEPWNTLMSFRRIDPKNKYKPCFAMMGAPRNEGVIEVGMILEVLALENRKP